MALVSGLRFLAFCVWLFSLGITHRLHAQHEPVDPDETEAYEFRISRSDFLDIVPMQEISLLQDNRGPNDSVSYLIVHHRGYFEEYIGIQGTGMYFQVSSGKLSQDKDAAVRVEAEEGILRINDVALKGFRKFPDFKKVKKGKSKQLCCVLCYLSHDILGIHFMDCMCCFGGCGYSCQEDFKIFWKRTQRKQ
ncbi:MAG: hypothetical protein KL787_09225 [Taibaiella sp.]|nr:hypothetical protein [Taibaiella sp.]